MDAPWNLAAVILAAAAVALLVYVMAATWRRVMKDDAKLPFFRMAEQQGVDLPLEGDAGALRVALVVRRCAMCSGKDECRAAFDAGHPEQALAGCPNVEFFGAARRRWRGGA